MLSIVEFFVFLLVVISTQGRTKHDPYYCYSEDPTRLWTPLGGSTSPYEPNRGNINANVSTCTPSKFWMAARHGSRLPFLEELPNLKSVVSAIHIQVLKNYNQGRTTLCASDYELLKNWQYDPNVTVGVAAYLTTSGWIEMETLAQRYQAAFPTILPSTYSPTHYYFQTNNYQRTIYSNYAFADGLFGVDSHQVIKMEIAALAEDVFLRSLDLCPLYKQQLVPILAEQNAFIQGPEYQEMVVQVSAKLGFHNANVLRNSDIALLANQCKFEQTWLLNYRDVSPLCAAFSIANAEVIEFSQHLDVYRRLGFGNPEYRRLYENLMCFPMQDMLRFIQSNDVNDYKAKIYNGHVSLLLLLLHFETLDGDALPNRHNFDRQGDRVWKSEFLGPMALNFAVIRYDCAGGDNDVLFLLNEKPLQIPGCDTNGVCKQSLILDRFSYYLNANCTEIYCTNE